MASSRRGFLGILIIFLLIGGLIGIYFGYGWYVERYYIKLYDGSVVRYLDIPPFTDRLNPASDDLKGECILHVGTSFEQAANFFSGVSKRYGYLAAVSGSTLTIDMRKNYRIIGEFKDNKIFLKWQPVLPEGLKKK